MTITPSEQKAIDRWHDEQMEVYARWKAKQAREKLMRDGSEDSNGDLAVRLSMESIARNQREHMEQNPKDLAGSRKPPLDLIPPVAEVEMAMAMKHGAGKFGKYNWRDKKIGVSFYIAAMKRHIAQFAGCQDYDNESGVHHLGHVMATAAILLDAFAHDCVNEDRVPSNVAELIREYTEKAGQDAKPLEDPTEVE